MIETYVLSAMVAPLLAAVILLAVRLRNTRAKLAYAVADYNAAVDREEETHQFLAIVGHEFFRDHS